MFFTHRHQTIFLEIDSTSAFDNNPVAFLPSTCLQVDQLKQTIKAKDMHMVDVVYAIAMS